MKRLVAVQLLGLMLLAGTARAEGPVLGFTVAASPAAATRSLPSASVPNAPGAVSTPAAFTTPPAIPQQLPVAALHTLWVQAGTAYGIPWQVLAAINKIESNFGRNMGPSSAGAVGWMQFMPDTWLRWGLDADGDGIADPWNASDAVYAAARYLAAAGGTTDISRGVFAYNHADWYVNQVLSLANVYGQGGVTETVGLDQLELSLDSARRQVADRNTALVAALHRLAARRDVSRRLHAKADRIELLSDRLAAQRRAVLYDARVEAVREATAGARAALEDAQSKLESARQQAQAPSFASGVSTLLAAPSYQSGYVFPVGGGAGVVSVGHTHHDYPAADIAAPAGSPVYALADGVVELAWYYPDSRCGIGLTIRTTDGLAWTYCHLSYLEPAVQTGATLTAGASIGLVGSTGHATGPHLHLQLQPATSYPQDQPWFQGFAGAAFRWQDAPTSFRSLTASVASPRVFTVVSPESESLIAFTRSGG